VFQFLGRNSGRSDLRDFEPPTWAILSFNSSVGILVVRTSYADVTDRDEWEKVSIPRSEFWSFGPRKLRRPGGLAVGFNSSVGILVVRTQEMGAEAYSAAMFQFLGRNSGRSDSV